MIREVDRYLREDGAAGRIFAHAQLLRRLGERLQAALPGALAGSVRLGNFRDGRAVVLADNGAVATKLRQLSQRLALELSRAGVECSGVDVRVLPQPIHREVLPPTLKPISAPSRDVLRSTAEGLPPGELRSALEVLLARSATAEE